jgi:hypothetical protein
VAGFRVVTPIGVTPNGVTQRGPKGVPEREKAPIGEPINSREHAAWALERLRIVKAT